MHFTAVLLPLAAQFRNVAVWQVHGNMSRGNRGSEGEGGRRVKSVREFQLINLPFFQWKFTTVKRFNMLIKAAFCRRRWFINSCFFSFLLCGRVCALFTALTVRPEYSFNALFSSNTQWINVACRLASWLTFSPPPLIWFAFSAL